ncbi:MAG: anaerobic C4-dicarboxylate transporter family protein [Verrucomicrobia bacterium]|nr:anaerobic C4-dicarboxylate transporter family protein [Verrucomicrobiota bacterium]
MFWLQLAIVLAAISTGVRAGGVAVGAWAVTGVLVLTSFFGNPPSNPPYDVVFIVLAIVTACATIQSTGGIDLLVGVAERILRGMPSAVTFLAPLVAYVFTLLAGTGYVAYALLPVIAEVAISANVRPERPLSISVISSQLAITASPVSAATATLIGMLSGANSQLGMIDVLLVCIPSTLGGCLMGAISVMLYPKHAAPIVTENTQSVASKPDKPHLTSRPRLAIAIFLAAVALIVLSGIFPQIRPVISDGKTTSKLGTAPLIQLLMFAVTAIVVTACRCKVESVVNTPIMKSGLAAILSITGVAWLGNCFFDSNRLMITSSLSEIVTASPWLFSVALFLLSALLYSQAATVAALMGLGFVLKLPDHMMIAMFPAVNGFFFFPTSGTVVAAVAFDRTGSTRIGRYVVT